MPYTHYLLLITRIVPPPSNTYPYQQLSPVIAQRFPIIKYAVICLNFQNHLKSYQSADVYIYICCAMFKVSC